MSQLRTIAFFGSRSLSHAPSNTFWLKSVVSGLQRRGFRVTFFEPHSDGCCPGCWDGADGIEVTSYPTDTEQSLYRALELAASADIIIKSSESGEVDEHLNRSLVKVARPRTQLVFWDLDPTTTLDRISANPDDAFRPLIPKYDLILTLGGGADVSDAYLKLGARLCVPISQGFERQLAAADDMWEHCVRELDVVLRPASLQPMPA